MGQSGDPSEMQTAKTFIGVFIIVVVAATILAGLLVAVFAPGSRDFIFGVGLGVGVLAGVSVVSIPAARKRVGRSVDFLMGIW
jgi:hypothetical protein